MVYGNKNWLDFEKPADKHAREHRETRAAVDRAREEREAYKAKHGLTREDIIAQGEAGREGAERDRKNRRNFMAAAFDAKKDENCGCPSKKRARSHSHSA